MGFLSRLFGSKKNLGILDQIIDLGDAAFFSIGIAKDKKAAKYECAILTSLMILWEAKSKYPRQYDEIEKEVFENLFHLSKKMNVLKRIQAVTTLEQFLQKRIKTYTDELMPMLTGKDNGRVPALSTYNLYEMPLQINDEVCFNPMIHMEFIRVFLEMFVHLEKSVPFLAEKIKLEKNG